MATFFRRLIVTLRCPRCVKTGKAQSDPTFSGLPPKADLAGSRLDVSEVPKAAVSNRSKSITSSAVASQLSGKTWLVLAAGDAPLVPLERPNSAL